RARSRPYASSVRGASPRSTAASARKPATAAPRFPALGPPNVTLRIRGAQELGAQPLLLLVVELPTGAILHVEAVGHLVEDRSDLRDVDLEVVVGDRAREVVEQPEAVVGRDVHDRVEVRLLVRDLDGRRVAPGSARAEGPPAPAQERAHVDLPGEHPRERELDGAPALAPLVGLAG